MASENLCADPTIYDYAIVGAGCSGLYCAWKLLEQDASLKIQIFEKDDHIGGRLLSLKIPGLENGRRAELGGMRFTDKHVLVNELIRNLRAEAQDDERKDLDPDPFQFETRLMYLRGRRLRWDDPDWAERSTYRLSTPVRHLSQAAVAVATEGIRRALDYLKPAYEAQRFWLDRLKRDLRKDALTTKEWGEIQKDIPVNVGETKRFLYEIGFWNLLHRSLPNNDFLFLHDSLGYESLLANSNAAQAVPTFLSDFDNPEYFTLAGGMQTLPLLLAKKCKAKGAKIIDKQKVTRIATSKGSTGKAGFCLEAEDQTSQATKSHTLARRVILALPKKAIKDIELSDDFEDGEKYTFHTNLDAVTSHPAFKLFLVYESPWWYEELGRLDARTTTDLPIRQIYYIGDSIKGNDPVRVPLAKEKSLLMASYSDEHYVDFWHPLMYDPCRERAFPQPDDPSVNDYKAGSRVVDKTKLMLNEIHQGTPPDPIDAYAKEWQEAWHLWNVHIEPWKISQQMIQPFNNLNLFTCGEAYSLEQGWVEGALKSAERVLLHLRKIDDPTWSYPNKAFWRYPKVNCQEMEKYIEN